MSADARAGAPPPAITATVDDLTALLERQAVVDVLYRYATALDHSDWDLLHGCFTPNALCDFGAWGRCQGIDEIVATVRAALAPFAATQHQITNTVVRFDGRVAWSKCHLRAEHLYRGRPTAAPGLSAGGSYHDELIRGDDGWLLTRRVLRATWVRHGAAPPA